MDPIPLLLLTKETTGEFVLSDVEQNNRPNMYIQTYINGSVCVMLGVPVHLSLVFLFFSSAHNMILITLSISHPPSERLHER